MSEEEDIEIPELASEITVPEGIHNEFLCETPKTRKDITPFRPKAISVPIKTNFKGFEVPFSEDIGHQNIEQRLSNIERKLSTILKLLKHGPEKEELSIKEEKSKFVLENGVDLLHISAVNPQKYALALMDAMFTEEEMAFSCFKESKRSTKKPLDKNKIKLLEDCIIHVYGKEEYLANASIIRNKCNQKCIDAKKKK